MQMHCKRPSRLLLGDVSFRLEIAGQSNLQRCAIASLPPARSSGDVFRSAFLVEANVAKGFEGYGSFGSLSHNTIRLVPGPNQPVNPSLARSTIRLLRPTCTSACKSASASLL